MRSINRVAGACLLLTLAVPGQNRKVRPEPSPLAARAGSAVEWRASVDDALAESTKSGRPVFWYVPTLRGSRMDRKPEIDRYMLAGPFSWPSVVELLNAHFVPVREPAGRDAERRFDLRPVQFVEPGFLVLDGAGKEIARLDEITTLHPRWFCAQLLRALPAAVRDDEAVRRAAAWTLSDNPATAVPLDDGGRPDLPRTAPERPEALFRCGAEAFWRGDEQKAIELWKILCADHGDDAWAFKAAAEIEGHGPLVNGFERHVALWPDVLEKPPPRGTRAPDGAYDAKALQVRGLDFLRSMQRADGGFVDSRYDFGGADSMPNVYCAITALAALATLETVALLDAGRAEPAAGPEFGDLVARAVDYVLDDGHLNRDDDDELIWAHLYRVRLLARLIDLRPGDAQHLRPELERAVQDVAAMQPESGAWFHEYPNPFVIASCLVALADARRHGVEAPAHVADRGVLALLRCRAQDGAITYGYPSRGTPRAQIAAGVGRMPAAEHALALWGHGEAGALERALAASFEHHDELAKVRKYDDHASPLGYGGFFFWYDLHVRGEAIEQLPDGAAKDGYRARQRAQILLLPELDGCFVDSHELGRVYGTAMALVCLAMARER